MKKILPLLLGSLALLALSVPVSASAVVCHASSGSFCINGVKTVGAIPMSFAQKPGANPVINLNSGSYVITCEVAVAQAPWVNSTESSGARLELTIKLKSCTGTPYKCKVAEEGEIRTNRLTGNFAGVGRETLTLAPISGNFFEFSIYAGGSETCPAALTGSYYIYGTVECSVAQVEVETISKEVRCEHAKSHLETRGGRGPVWFGGLEGSIALGEGHIGQTFSIMS